MFLQRLSVSGIDESAYYQSSTFNKAKGTINDLPNCTCYCMCRTYEVLGVDKALAIFTGCSAGGYPNAKYWYDRTTLPKGKELKEGSIAVFNGNSGHVAFVEKKIDGTHAIISQSQYDSNKSLRNYKYWEKRQVELVVGKATMAGIGALIGFIYLPIQDIRTDRNSKKEQILITEDMVNVRIKPDGQPYQTGCYIPEGIYDVGSQKNTGGDYTWYMVEDNHWVREGEWLRYFSKEATESELEKENKELKEQVVELQNSLAIANGQLDEIRKIVC